MIVNRTGLPTARRVGGTLAAAGLLAAVTVGTAALPAAAAGRGTASASASVRVVAPGQRVALGHGLWLTLTATEVCQGGVQNPTECDSVVNGNQAPDSVGLRTTGLANGPTLYQALYLGSGTVARMTLTEGKQSDGLQVVTLAGHPGYAVGYGWAPADATAGVVVRDASGGVLAQF
ncbi:hypothetical protein GXW83_18340 [Streptacidiphilus sp. PB12-B1b]|uniref:hypothetical protein n=1 Tax=Streptacidiphilus sp. PB12-B1b TaxID=2705012 RepID=UPI0015FB8BA3|nr:hypothetical protein [Streptacidiphilus sp. PB12-B1b]QMU77367.1 hypothetical protein GXW83_18340 [Streptacidiphilus sp. PB12-B1b]